MELPQYLRTLLAYRWLLLVGIAVAVLAGLVATFTVHDGQIVTRAGKSYSAATTIMLNNPTRPIYQAQFKVAQPSAGAVTESRDLDSVATVYAYIISGSNVEREVESSVGALRPGETIKAVQRTTQPGADATTQGRLSLPLIDVIGVSPSPQRAQQISRAANDAFQRDAVAQQDAQKLKDSDRVRFTTLDEGAAIEQDGSNPAIPGLAAGLGVLVLFALAIFVIDSIRTSRRSAERRERAGRRGRRVEDSEPGAGPTGAHDDLDPAPAMELSGAGGGAGR